MRLYPEKLEACCRFANKVWNAGRYILMTIPEGTPITPPQQVQSELAQWLLHGLNRLVQDVQDSLLAYRLSEVIDSLRGFFWGEFCDWHLEMDKKPEHHLEDNQVLAYAYTTLLKLLHPYVPFVTEALWSQFGQDRMLTVSNWPQPQPAYHFPEAHVRIELVKEAIAHIRALRDKANLGLDKKVAASLDSVANAPLFEANRDLIFRLARLRALEIRSVEPVPGNDALAAYFQDTLVRIDAAAVDWHKEIEVLNKKLKTENGFLAKSGKKLENAGFLSKAPEHIVTKLRSKVSDTEKTVEALRQQIQELERLAN